MRLMKARGNAEAGMLTNLGINVANTLQGSTHPARDRWTWRLQMLPEPLRGCACAVRVQCCSEHRCSQRSTPEGAFGS